MDIWNAKITFMYKLQYSQGTTIVVLSTSLLTAPYLHPGTVNVYSAVLYVRLVMKAWILNVLNAPCSTNKIPSFTAC